MRVISGSAKGRSLKTADGTDTRPTTDRVKESLFNIIAPHIYKATVLDLFSGSGGLGIEALSRGAEFADFVEKSSRPAACIKENLTKTGFSDKSALHVTDVFQFLENCKKKYDIIFMDPPYHNGLITKAAEIISHRNLLSEDGIIICECDHDESLPDEISGLKLYDKRKYGRVLLNFFKKM